MSRHLEEKGNQMQELVVLMVVMAVVAAAVLPLSAFSSP